MSRDDGFPRADVDSGYLEDAKMRELWQRLRDQERMARAVCIHAAVLLASWRHGERLTAYQACPLWLEADDGLLAELQKVKLLDKTNRITASSWAKWFGEAQKRRGNRSDAGRLGGIRSGEARRERGANHARNGRSNASATLQQNEANTNPASQPASHTNQPASQPAGARAGGGDLEADPADAYWSMSGRYPTGKPLGWIDDLTREFGPVPVIRAMAQAHQVDGTVSTLLGRTQDLLRRDARALDLKAQAEQRRLIAERRAAPRSEPDAAAVAAELRRMLGGAS